MLPAGSWRLQRDGPLGFDRTVLSVAGVGTESVECVTLDQVLAGMHPTMLKFDIEGAEPLRFAESVIPSNGVRPFWRSVPTINRAISGNFRSRFPA